MGYFVGLDISDATTNLCIVDKQGDIIQETKVSTNVKAITSFLKNGNFSIEKIGMETGPKSNVLYRALSSVYSTIVLDSHKVSKILSSQINKTDKNDARVIAEILRVGCFSHIFSMEVSIRSEEVQSSLTLIRTREDLIKQLTHLYNTIRGVCKTHGVNIPVTTQEQFTQVVRDILRNLPTLVALSIEKLMIQYDPLRGYIQKLDLQIEELVKENSNAQLLMTIPQIGALTALYFSMIIEDVNRFAKSRTVGAYLGLTPMQYSSGSQQLQGSISKRGDSLLRKLLVGAARRILQTKASTNDLKRWGQKKEKIKGKGKASVALARHLSGIMLAMLVSQTPYHDKELPLTKSRGVLLSREDLANLLQMSQNTGNVHIKSLKQLEKILQRKVST